MITSGFVGEIAITHNLSWPYIPGHSYRIFIVRGSGLGKTNALLDAIYHKEKDLFILTQYYYKKMLLKIYLYATDP